MVSLFKVIAILTWGPSIFSKTWGGEAWFWWDLGRVRNNYALWSQQKAEFFMKRVAYISGCISNSFRIIQEIEAVLGCRQFAEYMDLGNLQFLGQTLKESLRLHPPVSGTTRITTKDENIGGHLLPRGTSVNISAFIMHRYSEAWQEPDKFDPDRFSPAAKGEIPHSVFFPFSLGPRTCIGQTFAQIEARVFMARLLQEFELSLCPGQDKMEHEERLTLRPKGGVLCTLRRRNES